ncbi:MAG: hypothetical protein JWO81_2757, partial [Alphaproteobacteria bacterium]|nr:hypothetical protein [Alphaproteobacteria bacterium]
MRLPCRKRHPRGWATPKRNPAEPMRLSSYFLPVMKETPADA